MIMEVGRAGRRIIWAAAGFIGLGHAPASANCVSIIQSENWPAIARAISNVRLCEQLPVGPTKTRSFEVVSAEVCPQSGGLTSVRAQAYLTCETDGSSLFQGDAVEGRVTVDVTLEPSTCRITEAHLNIDDGLGGLLSGLTDTDDLARSWAQSQATRLCRLE
jgi:hypothetical protein